MPCALVFGSAGQLGAAVAGRLLDEGWTVWTVTREGRPPADGLMARGARFLDAADRSRAAVADGLDVRLDAVFDPTSYDRADAQDLVQAGRRCGTLVVVSSASVYAGPDGRSRVETSQSGLIPSIGPIPEDAPVVAAGEDGYSAKKAGMEEALLASPVPVSVLRPCAVYGRFSQHPREWLLIKRALDGRRAIPVAYGGRSVFHTTSASRLADLVFRCMERPGRRVLNVADDDAPSVRQIASRLSAATGLPMPLAPFAGPPVGPAHVGSTPWSAGHPFVLDTSAARALGWTGGSYGENVGPVCDWLVAASRRGDWRERFSGFVRYGYDPFDYAAEDAVLAAGARAAPEAEG